MSNRKTNQDNSLNAEAKAASTIKPLRIAILGTRGIPARYGGFETFAEELSRRLVERGHDVVVYGRRGFFEVVADGEVAGVKTVATPTIRQKFLETPVHAATSFLSLLFRPRVDVILLCNAANSPFAWLGRLKAPVVINVDGIERKRKKWNWLGRLWYRLGELSSVLFGSKVVADAEVIADYYRRRFKIEPAVIAYGATVNQRPPGAVMQELGVEQGRYLLYVSRLEPENNALLVIKAYREAEISIPLVIVGDAPYASAYKAQLREAAGDAHVIFAGFRFGEAYQELRSNCMFYIQATEVGGTHPALVEAMAYGNAILANDVPEHREVLLDCGLYYQTQTEAAQAMRRLCDDPELREALATKARARGALEYSWDRITGLYEELFGSGQSLAF